MYMYKQLLGFFEKAAAATTETNPAPESEEEGVSVTDEIEEGKTVDLAEELGDLLECPLCMDKCTQPKALPCQHWYCIPCLTTLIQTSERGGKFVCPSCRRPVDVPSGGAKSFPTAFIINRLNEAVEKQNKILAKPICSIHGESFGLFCDTCQEKLCIVCVLDHEGHSKVPIATIRGRRQKPLKQKLHQFTSIIKDHQSQLDDVTKSRKACLDINEENKNILKTHGEKIKNKVDAMVVKMQEKMSTETSNTVHQYDTLEKTMLSKLQLLSDATKEMETSLGDDTDDLDHVNMQHFEQILQGLDERHNIPKLEVAIHLADTEQLTERSLIGKIQYNHSKSSLPILSLANKVPSTSGLTIEKVSEFDIPYIPSAVACRPDGNIVVCENVVWGQVHVYKDYGRELSAFRPTFQTCNCPKLSTIFDIACTKNYMYITQNFANKDVDTNIGGHVVVYNKRGQESNCLCVHYDLGAGIALTDSRMFVTSMGEHIVYKMELPDGGNQQTFLTKDHGIEYPMYIATNGRSIAVSCENDKMYMFDMKGKLLFTYVCPGSSTSGVAIDRSGRLFISQRKKMRVAIVSPEGKHIEDIKLSGFLVPNAITLTKSGHVVVACQGLVGTSKIVTYKY